MMAKMFYTLDETKAALGRNEEEIKQFAREGRLREFRDGPRLMFKADQVESLRNELGLGGGGAVGGGGGAAGTLDHVDLGPSDTSGPLGLVDSRNASASGISLTDTDSGAAQKAKDDTALAAELGLSGSLGGSMGGVPSPGRVGTGSGLTSAGTAGGVTVFRPDEVERADPGAQTAISSGLQDQVNLEGVGSGSGLLDLTRESDDTSLGAELLDEISPNAPAAAGKRGSQGAESSAARTGVDLSSIPATTGPVVVQAPRMAEEEDAMSPAFGGAALAGAVFLLLGLYAMVGAMSGNVPQTIRDLGESTRFAQPFWFITGLGVVVAIVLFIVGMVVGRSGRKG